MVSKTLHKALCCALALMCVSGCVEENATPGPDRQAYEPAEIAPLTCTPNLDSRIDSVELAETLGVPVTQLVSPAGSMPAVDIAGQVNVAGERLWDLSASRGDEQFIEVEAQALTGKWYASSFPTGEFVTLGDAAGRTENIFRRDEQGLYLLGVASTEENPAEGKTLLVYEQPVSLYLFPLETGKNWVSVGTTRNATLRGLPYAGRDTYEVTVEALGALRLPDLTFEQVHMVRTEVLLEPAVGTSISQQQISYLFECFGEVARITSQNNENEPFFTTASEVRRLGLDERGVDATLTQE